MKITTHYLKSLILEAILKEYSEYFGKEFIAFKNRYEKGEDPLFVAQSMLKEIGSGSTRRVFEFSDNPTTVLKVINTEVQPKTSRANWEGHPEDSPMQIQPGKDFDTEEDIHGFTVKDKLLSNQWESDLTMQQLYPDVFPRTFEIADDYSWILSERVKPLKTFQDLLNVINLEDEIFSQGRRGVIQFQAIIEVAVSVLDPKDNEIKKLVSEAMLEESPDLAPTLKVKPANKRKPKMNLFKSRIIKVLSDPHTRKILRAMGDLDIPVREFSAKNLGISEISGKLMLLDASLWKEYKPLR